jgi:C-terminal processing protease CtpA/Prc
VREALIARYLPTSTPQGLVRQQERYLLAGTPDSDVQIELRNADGETRTVDLTRDRATIDASRISARAGRLPVFGLLPQGVAYFDLARLPLGQVDAAFRMAKDAPGIVMDLRGYPKGAMLRIAPNLTAEPVVGARFRVPRVLDPAGQRMWHQYDQRVPAGNGPIYEGRIVVLVDNRAISQSEHTCLLIESCAKDVTFVGTPTVGANGVVTYMSLPGGVIVRFTGQEVRHADGRPLQRVGIQPDVEVAPTIAGVRAGRDEVLEAGIRVLTE